MREKERGGGRERERERMPACPASVLGVLEYASMLIVAISLPRSSGSGKRES
jgi:hypothetical protein